MVQVNDRFACGGAGDGTGLALWAGDAMDAEEIAVFGEDNVLFDVVIAKYGAEVLKIVCFAYAIGEASSLWL
jgi:hypothetical protein